MGGGVGDHKPNEQPDKNESAVEFRDDKPDMSKVLPAGWMRLNVKVRDQFNDALADGYIPLEETIALVTQSVDKFRNSETK